MSIAYDTSNPKELKDLILRRLGAPIINIELTETQIFDCISRAIELFTEYHPDGLNRTFIAVKLNEEQALTGIINFDKPIYSVTKILRISESHLATFDGATHHWFTGYVHSLASGHCNTYHPFGWGADLTTYSMYQSYYTLLMDQLDPIQDFWYNSMTHTVNVGETYVEGDIIIFEAWAETSMLVEESATGLVGNKKNTVGMLDDYSESEAWDDPYERLKVNNYVGNPELYAEQGVYNIRWVKDYSTSLCKELNGTILRKHQGMQLPGGITIDGQTILQEAKEEMTTLREELLQLSEPLPVLWG